MKSLFKTTLLPFLLTGCSPFLSTISLLSHPVSRDGNSSVNSNTQFDFCTKYDHSARPTSWTFTDKLVRKWEINDSRTCYHETLAARDDIFFPTFTNAPNAGELEFFAINLKTCAVKSIVGSAARSPKLWIDLTPSGNGSFHVENGMNQIQYQLTVCHEKDEKGLCLVRQMVESGSLYLQIDSTEIWIPEKTVSDPPRCLFNTVVEN